MMLRGLTIILAGLATWALWFGYGQLSLLRGTQFWDFRYVIFAILGLLGLSAVEWALGWIKKKTKDG
ncbi:MAG: hypothetical protein WBC93_08380 [Sulfitobacter sp.]